MVHQRAVLVICDVMVVQTDRVEDLGRRQVELSPVVLGAELPATLELLQIGSQQ